MHRSSQVRSPKVVIVSGNKFHSYHMARGAVKAGWLERFVTTIFDNREIDIPISLVAQIPAPAIVARIISQIPMASSQTWSYFIGDNWFDRASSRYVRNAAIYHGFNHHSLHSMRIAKSHGATTIVERASAHPIIQHQLLREEFNRFGITYPSSNRWIINKHIQEYSEADWIMVPSDFVYRTMINQGIPSQKLIQVKLGFEPRHFYKGSKQDDKFRVIYVGALSLQKGLPYLLEGFRRAKLPPDKSELVLVGEPFPESKTFLPDYKTLYRHIRFIQHRDLVHVYNTGSVFVLPSLQDGFGMVVYEAAACGLPIIITENVGAEIIDGEHGFIVPIRSADAIAEKLTYLYEHPDKRAQMGNAASQYVGQFTWNRYQNELVGHYIDIWKRKK